MLFTEWCIITYYSSSSSSSINSEINELSEYLHELIWFARKAYIYISFGLIILCAYLYSDLNTLNNKLLLDIKNDHAELKNLICEIKSKNLSTYYADDECSTIIGDDEDDDGTLSVCSSACTLNTTMSDCTYVPGDDDSRDNDFDDWHGFNSVIVSHHYFFSPFRVFRFQKNFLCCREATICANANQSTIQIQIRINSRTRRISLDFSKARNFAIFFRNIVL
jgi:hypothetical protein